MAIVIADLFTETADTNLESHVPNTGTGWTLAAGAAGACLVSSSTDTLRSGTTTASHYVSNPEPANADTYALFRSKTLNPSPPANSYVCVRLVNNTNFVGWRLAGNGAAGRRLSKNVAGTITDLITSQGVADEWIKVEASGNIVKLWQGGTGATPAWVQVGANQTVTDHNTETSIGFQIGSNSTIDWIDEYEGGTVDGGITAALTGQSLTLAQGTLSAAIVSSVTGQSLSLAQGTVVVEAGVTAVLTGQSLSLAQGTASPVVTAGLSGQSLALAQGAVVGSVVSAITGQSIALAQGSVTAAIVAPLTGQAITLAQGTVGVAGDIVRALTGQSVGIAQGQMVAQDLRANRGGGWETYVAPRRRKTLEQYKEEYSELPYIEIVDKKEEVEAEVAQIQAEITQIRDEVEFSPDVDLVARLKAAIETQKVKLRALKWVEETKRERAEETKRERVVHDDLVWIVAYLLGDDEDD